MRAQDLFELYRISSLYVQGLCGIVFIITFVLSVYLFIHTSNVWGGWFAIANLSLLTYTLWSLTEWTWHDPIMYLIQGALSTFFALIFLGIALQHGKSKK
ncbi:MAG: hypothetical protein HY391_06275 [Deltaproteobacteria bacterium]|nr:hypothetical protein [Deltaproteobacteria bacterium]